MIMFSRTEKGALRASQGDRRSAAARRALVSVLSAVLASVGLTTLIASPPLGAVATTNTYNLAKDFGQSVSGGSPTNPFGPWTFIAAPEATASGPVAVDQTDTTTYKALTTFGSCGSSAQWSATSDPSLTGFAKYQSVTSCYGQAGTVDLSPGDSSSDVGVTWTAPKTGTVRISGSLWDNNPCCGGNGILWYLNQNSTEVASGGFGNGGTQDLNSGAGTLAVTETGASSLSALSVTAGDTISLLVDPNLDYVSDDTGVQLVITYDAYPKAVLGDSPTAYYRLDESSGTVAHDFANAPVSGTYGSAATLGQPGALSNDADTAVSSDGTGPVVRASGAGLPIGNAARTIEAWFKLPAGGSGNPILVQYGGSGGNYQQLSVRGNSSLGDVFGGGENDWSVPSAMAPSPNGLFDGNWHYVALTIEPNTPPGQETDTMYLDGQSLGSQVNPSISTASGPLEIGAGTYYDTLRGSIDEVAIYSSALSASQIKAHHDASPSVQSTETLTANKSGTGNGTVTSSPSGVDCGPTCAYAFDSGTLVTLTATANAGSTFTSWTGCASTSADTCTVMMSAARSVTAAHPVHLDR